MPDKPWKQFERDAARAFGAVRHPANSGHRLDFESDIALGQCKLVRVMSLEALTQLAEEVARLALPKQKLGVVVCKVRRGAGRKSSALVVMTLDMYEAIHGRRSEQLEVETDW
jgi:hypothetical protein